MPEYENGEDASTKMAYNIKALAHHIDARVRVYPQVAGTSVNLAATDTADEFGSWTEIVPFEIIDFAYKVVGLIVNSVDTIATYFFQLGYSTVALSEPTTAQILCETAVKMLATPVTKATALIELHASECPANAKLWGRVKSSTTGEDVAGVAVRFVRHIPLKGEFDKLATWPYST